MHDRFTTSLQSTASQASTWFLEVFPHYRIPQLLLTPEYADLPPSSKLVFAVIISRMALSKKNQDFGWTFNGECYCYLKISEISSMLGCGHDAATGYLRALERRGLIRREKQGLGKPARITILPLGLGRVKFAYNDTENQLSGGLFSVKPESGNLAGK